MKGKDTVDKTSRLQFNKGMEDFTKWKALRKRKAKAAKKKKLQKRKN